jgi:2-phospho-L-lactate guanylyltransferase
MRREAPIYAIVPVKLLAHAKNRLSELLTPHERRDLVVAMFSDLLASLSASQQIDHILVVTADPQIEQITKQHGLRLFPEQQPHGINQALSQATDYATQLGARSVLAIHADLPLVAPSDIDQLLSPLAHAEVVLAPARDGGTNAIALHLPQRMPFCFEGRSFARHLSEARERNLSVALAQQPALMHDVDRPEDLIRLFETTGTTSTQRLIRQLGILKRVACV